LIVGLQSFYGALFLRKNLVACFAVLDDVLMLMVRKGDVTAVPAVQLYLLSPFVVYRKSQYRNQQNTGDRNNQGSKVQIRYPPFLKIKKS
jgi:hypothetical protein